MEGYFVSTINEIFETASKKMSENLNITLHTSHELANIVAQVGAFKDRTNELNSEIVDEIVYDLFNKSNPKSDKVLTIETYRKIKQRNTQTSQRGTNWLEYID